MQRYSVQFRNTILQKMIGPEKRTAADLSEEFGVSAATIYGWKSKLKDGTLSVMGNESTSHERRPSEKLMLLLESKNVSKAEMGEWLRRNGLHSEHLGLWEQELRALVDQKGGDKSREMREIRKELKKRDKELNRKDKALAEMSTIIALQKKTSLLFQEGRVTHRRVKKQIVSDIKEAVALGAPIYKCCDALGIQTRTYYRWTQCSDDKRSGKARANPRALSEQEKDAIVAVCCSKRFVDTNPYEIVAILAEEDTYLASPRTFYRVLKQRGLLSHRRSSKPPRKSYRPPELKATGPDQVYSWDITWMPSQVNGLFWYAYAVIDVWSREIVGWTIHDSESEKYARELFLRIKAKRDLKGTWLHADNGNPMRGATFAVTLANMGMFLSHSRPLVKNDNPFIESFFRTLKYHAGYPRRFAAIDEARSWTADFVNWYNTIHRHSGIGYVTPVQRRTGASSNLFARRNRTLQAAWKKHPERFPKRGPRMWRERMVVYLNPSRETRKFRLFRVSCGTRHQIQSSQMEENGSFEPLFIAISTSYFFDSLNTRIFGFHHAVIRF